MTAIHGSRAAVSRRHSATVARCRQMAVDRLVLHIYSDVRRARSPLCAYVRCDMCDVGGPGYYFTSIVFAMLGEKERRERDKERDRAERMIVKRLKRAVPQLIAGHGGA